MATSRKEREMLEQEWISIKAKFSSKCLVCTHEVNAGDSVFWSKGVGVKHVLCPNAESEYKHESRPEPDWKEKKTFLFSELKNVKNCQLCDTDLKNDSASYIIGFAIGFRRFCNSCFKKI